MICIDCVTPAPLKALISTHEKKHPCKFCGIDNAAIEPKVLFDYILDRIAENTATEDELSSSEYWMLFEGGSDEIALEFLDIVLSEWAGLGDEPYFDELYEYAPKEFKVNSRGMDRHFFADNGLLESNSYEAAWHKFTLDVRHSHRFFNPDAKAFLDSVFSFMAAEGDMLKPECTRVISKGEPLYRARSASDYQGVKKIAKSPASELGATPKTKASSQRMTPNGISAIYCALERETCLSEIRAITGDNVVSIAMTPVNTLKFLDLTKLDQVEAPARTLLDEGCRDTQNLKAFVASLVKKMSKPKGRNDELSYLSTQVVFEYLRFRFGSQVNGLVFPSVQTGEKGTNVVLFPEASVVSEKNYRDMPFYQAPAPAAGGFEGDLDQDAEEPFEAGDMLYCVSGSLRFHRVTAIETKADEYTHIGSLFMAN
ncbi:RES family NAD+ phosphorylase [Janthinobacterium sp. BJB304]|uniref:RES family NAD+ phosphorylase n=1 Tax=Janthinobacterium sp. BJB304 TaxID=1572871 RepID=UPI000C0C7719|nr:RES family NAD+ phosphorylase [Janthinobacterium sp. BJB304]PHV35650.1 hypothetical protein CSQ95_28505 [Janthinobacterium sp. BJB304]